MSGGDLLVFDPLRKKSVPLTPEERVRQWFIEVLHDDLEVPMGVMMSEVGMRFGEMQDGLHGGSRKEYRADILVYGKEGEPLMVVECKRPELALDKEVLGQALKYGNLLGVRYVTVTNGDKTFFARRDGDGSVSLLAAAPKYSDMTR